MLYMLLAALTLGLLTAVAQGDVCTKRYSCMSCSQVKICRNTSFGLKEAFQLTCRGDNSYCDENTGTCTDVPNKNCADTGVFQCMQDGIYPDLTSCQQYHVCENDTSFTFRCSGIQTFDGYNCRPVVCSTFVCGGKTNIKVPHPYNANVFAYCLHNKPLFVDRCSDGEFLDEASQQCYQDTSSEYD